MSLSKEQFIKNSVWTFLELTLYPVLMIVATPLFIKKLGIEQYGLWMLVSTITLGMNVLNIGVGDTNIRLISKYRAENNTALIRRVFNFNFSLSLFLCFAACLVGCIFYSFNFIALFYKTNDYRFANAILLLASVSTGLKFVEISLLSVFKAFERFDINSKLVLFSKNSVMVSNLLLVLLNYSLTDIFVVSISITVVNILIQLLTLRFFKKGMIGLPSFVFFKEKLDELNYNFWYWLQSAVALLGFLADKLVVAYFTDVKTLGYYSIASLIGTQIHNFFLAFGSFIFPRVSFKLAENKDVDRVYFISRSLVALPGWSLIVFLILFGDVIFRLWLGTDTFMQSIYFIKLYLVYEAGMLLIIVPFYFINGTRQIKLNSLFELLIRTTHFLATISGYYLAGVNGIIYGLILSTFVNIPFQYFYFHNRVLLGAVNGYQYMLTILPVVFMLGLIIFANVFFTLFLTICIIISCKIIYFDPARQYSKQTILFNNLFNRLENK
jgi:O-antigen/teichoic acid export membrane protein